MTESKLHVSLIEDFEFEGDCSQCGRHGLRWVATLSDGTRVGLECVKKILGYRPRPTQYNWIEHFELITTHNDHGIVYGLWGDKATGGKRQTRETRCGYLNAVGRCREDWERRGWLSPLMNGEGQ